MWMVLVQAEVLDSSLRSSVQNLHCEPRSELELNRTERGPAAVYVGSLQMGPAWLGSSAG